MKLIITIDTEEDNWGQYNVKNGTVENIKKIPELQNVFDDFRFKPTYLLSYPVASNDHASDILKKILDKGNCEIGSHCHPWNTPPYEEELGERNSMLCNLPSDLQYKKIKFLNQTILKNFNVSPVSFRSGRWGFSQTVAKNILELGIKVDTSITPFVDWTPSHGPDYSTVPPDPFSFSDQKIFHEPIDSPMMEIPASIGFLQDNFLLCNKMLRFLSKKPFSHLRIPGILERLNIINKVWLSPEMANGRDMIRLTRRFMKKDFKYVNLFFHSPSLKRGLTPFVKTRSDEKEFLNKIKEYLRFSKEEGIEPMTLFECQDLY